MKNGNFMQKREGSDPKMDAKHYLEIIKEQKAYYERDVQKQLLAGKGVKEDSPECLLKKPAFVSLRDNYFHEMRGFHERGIRITVEGRDLTPGEFCVAAQLLAEGRLVRRMIRGNSAPESEYRMSIKTIMR